MATTSMDPEDALDMLGLEEPAETRPAEPTAVSVEFPPMAAPPRGNASPIATEVTDPKRPAVKAPVPGATGSAASDKLLKAAQEAEKKANDRVKKLEEDIATLRKELTQALKSSSSPGELDKIRSERDQLRQEVDALRAQVKGGPVRGPALPDDDDGTPLPREGALDQVPYARVMVKLYREKFTGRMQLRSGKDKREIYFEDGQPVAHTSSGPGEPLGRVLVTQGVISEEQYLAAARAMVERGAKLTEALLEMGAIDGERLQREQRTFTRDQIIAGYALTQGNYSLETGKTAPEEAARFEFRLGEIYLAGYRRFAPENEVKAVFASMKESYVRARSEMHQLRAQLTLDGDDERLLKMLGEAFTVDEAIERSGVNKDGGARLLAALKTLGLITEWKPGVAEFEQRLKTERIRQTEEVLANKQRLREREEQLIAELQKPMQRMEQMLKDLLAKGGVTSSAARDEMPATPPSSSSTGSGTSNRLKKPTMGVSTTVQPERTSVVAPPSPPPPREEPPPPMAPAVSLVEEPKAEDGPGHDKYKEGMRQASGGRLDEAELALREAVRLDATKPAYLTALARVLLANPRYDRSGTLPVVRSLLDRAQTLAPGDAEVTALLQRIQQEMG